MTVAGVQAAYDVIVVGAGLSGLFAGVLAARRGARTLVIARGLGGTHLGPGTIDVWGYEPGGAIAGSPTEAIARLAGPQHPLRLAGPDALAQAVADFQGLCWAAGYPLAGRLNRNLILPTALGVPRPTCLAPESFAAGDLGLPGELTLGDLPGFRDFYADYAAANLRTAGLKATVTTLDLPRGPARRDLYATDLARFFDQPDFRAEAALGWLPRLGSARRLGLPAVLGLAEAHAAWQDMTARLGVPVFEIPVLPPSVPGMRLFNLLQTALEASGGRLTIGPGVTGWLEGGRAAGVIAQTAGGPRRYAGRAVILATGAFRHGGLQAPEPGRSLESVFDLPVSDSGDWFAPLYWSEHPYSRFGVRVNEHMQPVGADGAAIYPNLYAAGGVLAGADRLGEGSREGIDLATAWKAVARAALPAADAALKAAA